MMLSIVDGGLKYVRESKIEIYGLKRDEAVMRRSE